MPITSEWANDEKTIVYFIYEQPWDSNEFRAAILQVNALLDTVQHPVDMIIQLRDSVPQVSGAWPFRTAIRNFHPNIRNTALVGASDFMRRTISAFMRLFGQHQHSFFFAATLEEAHQRLGDCNNVVHTD